ncbi:hypothetical protein LY474_05190 [Myxococcus stipitatus]|nr:hypothetical protein [Myxococcus stipitatus]MCE9667205.1 hypothetical protein [Myxococcus stipitatus]
MNAVALRLVAEQAQLGGDERDDAHARDEAQRIRVLDFEGARHGHLQAPALLRERKRQMLLRQGRGQQRQGRVRDGIEVRILRDGEARLLPQHHGQGVDVEDVQFDEDGAQPPTVDELGLEGFVELRLRDEALADQDRSELFGHAAPIVDGFTVDGTGLAREPLFSSGVLSTRTLVGSIDRARCETRRRSPPPPRPRCAATRQPLHPPNAVRGTHPLVE